MLNKLRKISTDIESTVESNNNYSLFELVPKEPVLGNFGKKSTILLEEKFDEYDYYLEEENDDKNLEGVVITIDNFGLLNEGLEDEYEKSDNEDKYFDEEDLDAQSIDYPSTQDGDFDDEIAIHEAISNWRYIENDSSLDDRALSSSEGDPDDEFLNKFDPKSLYQNVLQVEYDEEDDTEYF